MAYAWLSFYFPSTFLVTLLRAVLCFLTPFVKRQDGKEWSNNTWVKCHYRFEIIPSAYFSLIMADVSMQGLHCGLAWSIRLGSWLLLIVCCDSYVIFRITELHPHLINNFSESRYRSSYRDELKKYVLEVSIAHTIYPTGNFVPICKF